MASAETKLEEVYAKIRNLRTQFGQAAANACDQSEAETWGWAVHALEEQFPEAFIPESDPKPNPGSGDAKALGCVCPREDNCYGKGWRDGAKSVQGETLFVISDDCPLHGRKVQGKAG